MRLLAASASLDTGFNIAVTLDVPDWVVLLGAHCNWAALSLNVMAWNLPSVAHFHRTPARLERLSVALAASPAS